MQVMSNKSVNNANKGLSTFSTWQNLIKESVD